MMTTRPNWKKLLALLPIFAVFIPLFAGLVGGLLFVGLAVKSGGGRDLPGLFIFVLLGPLFAYVYCFYWVPVTLVGYLAAVLQLRLSNLSPHSVGYITAIACAAFMALSIAVGAWIGIPYKGADYDPHHWTRSFWFDGFPFNWRYYEGKDWDLPYNFAIIVVTSVFVGTLWAFWVFRRAYLMPQGASSPP